MLEGDASNAQQVEVAAANVPQHEALLSRASVDSGDSGDDLIIHHGSSTSLHDEGALKTDTAKQEDTALPNGEARTPRTQNRVRFDITDDGEGDLDVDVEAHGYPGAEPGSNWLNEDDYLDDDDGRMHNDSHHQSAPLLTNIEAPSVTVATSSALSPEDALDDSHSKSGLGSAFMNMANSIIGAGIIGQPYAIRQAGMVTGILLLVALTVIVDWTIRLIVINSKLSGADSFQATVERCFGRPGLIAISLAQWVFAFGGMIAFCIIVGDTIPHVLMALFPSLEHIPVLSLLTNRRACIIIFIMGVSFPLSLYRDISKVNS